MLAIPFTYHCHIVGHGVESRQGVCTGFAEDGIRVGVLDVVYHADVYSAAEIELKRCRHIHMIHQVRVQRHVILAVRAAEHLRTIEVSAIRGKGQTDCQIRLDSYIGREPAFVTQTVQSAGYYTDLALLRADTYCRQHGDA